MLSVITFISGHETMNTSILDAYNSLKDSGLADELVIFSDTMQGISGEGMREEISPGTTKYMRILSSLEITAHENILYIDNDITPDIDSLKEFVSNLRSDTDLYFGKIGVRNPESFTAHLVQIDKTISHNIIRPLLWGLGVGISLPGQVFILRRGRFLRDMPRNDTVFDDLAIGICAVDNGYSVQRSKLTLGYEEPSGTLGVLIRQRIRWARGYYEQISATRNSRILPLVILHGLVFHVVSPVMLPAIGLLLGGWAFFAAMMVMCLCAADFRLSRVIYAAAYFVVFPVIHAVWLCALLKNFAGAVCGSW